MQLSFTEFLVAIAAVVLFLGVAASARVAGESLRRVEEAEVFLREFFHPDEFGDLLEDFSLRSFVRLGFATRWRSLGEG